MKHSDFETYVQRVWDSYAQGLLTMAEVELRIETARLAVE